MEEQNLNRTEQKGQANKRGTTLWSSLNNGEPKPEQKGWAYQRGTVQSDLNNGGTNPEESRRDDRLPENRRS